MGGAARATPRATLVGLRTFGDYTGAERTNGGRSLLLPGSPARWGTDLARWGTAAVFCPSLTNSRGSLERILSFLWWSTNSAATNTLAIGMPSYSPSRHNMSYSMASNGVFSGMILVRTFADHAPNRIGVTSHGSVFSSRAAGTRATNPLRPASTTISPWSTPDQR